MNIPGFKLGRQYADGQFCTYYNALNLSNHKTVNVQVFRSSLVASQEFAAQFRAITGKLVGARYGITPRTLQAEIANHTCYVITEYFPIPQQLPAKPPSLSRYKILQFALQLAQTLDELHQAGLIHGGIEYSSLFFRSSNELVLRPVMLQRAMPRLRAMTLDSLGPSQRRYLAPEADKGLTPATDFYALGVVLYQLIFNPASLDPADAELPPAWLFSGEDRDLEPFFHQLLTADSAHRIQSFDQFRSALEQCSGETPVTASMPVAEKPQPNANQGAGTSASALKWIAPSAGLAMAALAGYLAFAPEDELPQAPPTATSPAVETRTASAEPSPGLTTQPPVVAPKNLETRLLQAQTQAINDPEGALQRIDQLLAQQPDHRAAIQLKQQIEQALSARSIMRVAERQLQEAKLLQPSGDNAYETYLSLAETLSPDDKRVISGFTRIAAAYHSQAETLLAEGLPDKALETIELGLSVRDDYSPLLELRNHIDDLQSAQEQKQRLARIERQRREERKREAQQREQEQRQQQAQQAQLVQQRQIENQATDELERLQRQQAQPASPQPAVDGDRLFKQARVESLLTSANTHLNNGQLTLEHVFSAHQDYEELSKLDAGNPEVTRLKSELTDAYSILAIRQNNDELYKQALQALEEGVQLNPQERRKLQIKSQLSR